MYPSWAAIVFGWPSALGGALLLLLGGALRRVWVAALGAAVSAGFCAYLAMNPSPFGLLGVLTLAANVASVAALRRQAPWLALLLLLPYLTVLTYLALAVAG